MRKKAIVLLAVVLLLSICSGRSTQETHRTPGEVRSEERKAEVPSVVPSRQAQVGPVRPGLASKKFPPAAGLSKETAGEADGRVPQAAQTEEPGTAAAQDPQAAQETSPQPALSSGPETQPTQEEEPRPAPAPTPDPMPEPDPTPTLSPMPAPAPEPTPEPTPAPAPAPIPSQPTPEPDPEPQPEPDPEPEEPAFDIGRYVQYARDYALSVGLELDPDTASSWDTPMIFTAADAPYIEQSIRERIAISLREGDTAIWCWAENLGDGRYAVYISRG